MTVRTKFGSFGPVNTNILGSSSGLPKHSMFASHALDAPVLMSLNCQVVMSVATHDRTFRGALESRSDDINHSTGT